MFFLLFVIVIVVVVAAVIERRQHDHLGGYGSGFSGACYPIWRQALLVSLILTIPVVIVAKRDFPGFFEFIFVAFVIFCGVYFSHKWLMEHFIVSK